MQKKDPAHQAGVRGLLRNAQYVKMLQGWQ